MIHNVFDVYETKKAFKFINAFSFDSEKSKHGGGGGGSCMQKFVIYMYRKLYMFVRQ